jgi:hypothetical protein
MTVRPAGVPNRALWGLFVDCITSGRYPAALTVAEKFCNYAAKSTDPADAPDRRAGNRIFHASSKPNKWPHRKLHDQVAPPA